MKSTDFLNDLDEPKNEELLELSMLAEKQLHLERRVVELEDLLAATKEDLRQVQEIHIPEAMAAIGMSEFKLSNGYKVSVRDDVYASIRKDFLGNAVQWLDENGLGGIVKDQVAVEFGRGEFDNVNELLDFCVANGLNASEKLSVHPMTLKGVVKEQMAKGVQFPEEYFSIAPVRKAIIKTR